MKKRNIDLRLVVLVVILIGFLFTLKKKQPSPTKPPETLQSQQAQKPTKATPQKPVFPQQPQNKLQNLIQNNNSTTSSQIKREGYCKYDRETNRKYLATEIVRHLQTTMPEKLILPRDISFCFTTNKSPAFQIVEYDPQEDFLYDNLGEISLQLELISQSPSLQNLIDAPHWSAKKFGFRNTQELIQFVYSQGGNSDSQVLEFKVIQFQLKNVRQEIGTYREHVGIQFSDWKSIKSLTSSQGNFPQIIFGIDPKKYNIAFDFKYHVLDMAKIKNLAISHPRGISTRLSGADIPSLSSATGILLIPESYSDLSMINFANMLRLRNYSNITIIQGGLAEHLGIDMITPKDLKNFKTIQFEDLIKSQYSYLDLRDRYKRTHFEFSPYYYMQSSVLPSRLVIQEQLKNPNSSDFLSTAFRHLDLEKLMHVIQKNLVIIGKNEFDWNPVYLSDFLHNTSLAKQFSEHVFWLREGFDGIVLKDRLGLVDQNLYNRIGLKKISLFKQDTVDTKTSKVLVLKPQIRESQYSLTKKRTVSSQK